MIQAIVCVVGESVSGVRGCVLWRCWVCCIIPFVFNDQTIVFSCSCRRKDAKNTTQKQQHHNINTSSSIVALHCRTTIIMHLNKTQYQNQNIIQLHMLTLMFVLPLRHELIKNLCIEFCVLVMTSSAHWWVVLVGRKRKRKRKTQGRKEHKRKSSPHQHTFSQCRLYTVEQQLYIMDVMNSMLSPVKKVSISTFAVESVVRGMKRKHKEDGELKFIIYLLIIINLQNSSSWRTNFFSSINSNYF